MKEAIREIRIVEPRTVYVCEGCNSAYLEKHEAINCELSHKGYAHFKITMEVELFDISDDLIFHSDLIIKKDLLKKYQESLYDRGLDFFSELYFDECEGCELCIDDDRIIKSKKVGG